MNMICLYMIQSLATGQKLFNYVFLSVRRFRSVDKSVNLIYKNNINKIELDFNSFNRSIWYFFRIHMEFRNIYGEYVQWKIFCYIWKMANCQNGNDDCVSVCLVCASLHRCDPIQSSARHNKLSVPVCYSTTCSIYDITSGCLNWRTQ